VSTPPRPAALGGSASPTRAAGPAATSYPEIGLSYTLDVSNTIVAVGGCWDDFARNNDGEAILAAKIIGRKLDEFVSGDTTRMFVRTMIMSARTLQRPLQRPYRCDSPQLKRFMEMILQPGVAGAVEIMHRQLRCEPIPRPVRLLAAAPGTASTGTLTKRCSLCNRVLTRGRWREIDDAVSAEHLAADSTVRVIFGVCGDCLAQRGTPL
jgi:hypothetical protein